MPTFPLETLAVAIRDRLGPCPEDALLPTVSVVVPNRDGVDCLRRLLSGLSARTDYPALELIVVDNGSSDGSLDFIESAPASFPISALANARNDSFSDACNQGAGSAAGELLLFLNNDVEPFEPGWLRELVACLQGSGAGAVGATLLCSEEEHERSFAHGYGVQHRGHLFVTGRDGTTEPVLRGWEADPLDKGLGDDAECESVAASCLLVENRTFREIGGFSPGYFYGCEDVDLCLKLRAAGLKIVCAGRSVLIHHPATTRRAIPFEQARAIKLANHRLLHKRWGPGLTPDSKRL